MLLSALLSKFMLVVPAWAAEAAPSVRAATAASLLTVFIPSSSNRSGLLRRRTVTPRPPARPRNSVVRPRGNSVLLRRPVERKAGAADFRTLPHDSARATR